MSEKQKRRKDSKGRVLRAGESERADGRYVYRYNNINGKREYEYASTLSELRQKEKKIQDDLQDGISTKGDQATLNEQIEIYLSTKRLRNSTRVNYEYYWEKHIKDSRLGNMKICDIRKSAILAFYNSKKDEGLADGTIHIFQKIIRPALNLAFDEDLIRKNPANGCTKGYYEKKDRYALTVEQQKAFTEFVKETKPEYYPLIMIMIGTACRVSEIAGLTWNDVDMKQRMINIDHQLLYRLTDEKTEFYTNAPKTKAGIRKIPMTAEVFTQLTEQKKLMLKTMVRKDFEIDGYTGFVFLSRVGNPLCATSINNRLTRLVKNYNELEAKKAVKEKRDALLLPHISAHILRHTGCTRMAEAGLDIRMLQYIMGHNDISMTMTVYNHIQESRLESEIKKMDVYYTKQLDINTNLTPFVKSKT